MTPNFSRCLRRDGARDWFSELYGSERSRSLVDCSLIALEGRPGSSKTGMLGRLSKMGFRTVCLPFVPFVRSRLLAKSGGSEAALEQVNEAEVRSLASEWANAWYTAVGEQYRTVQLAKAESPAQRSKQLIFTLRYPPITLAASKLHLDHRLPFDESTVAVLECVSDGIRASERLAERFWIAREDQLELRLREALGEREDGSHASTLTFAEAAKQTGFRGTLASLHSTDTKQAVAALLEMVGHITVFPDLTKNDSPRLVID